MTKIDPARFVYRPGHSEVADVDLDQVEIHSAATGQRVTEADLDAEARDLERQHPGLVPGGKSLSGDGSHSPVLRVVVSQGIADAVRAHAKQERMSVSRYLRRLIERDLAS